MIHCVICNGEWSADAGYLMSKTPLIDGKAFVVLDARSYEPKKDERVFAVCSDACTTRLFQIGLAELRAGRKL